jgi:hypothetical protein
MEIISKTKILSWEDFAEIFSKYSDDSASIYRGQSNGFIKNEFQEWNLIPSYYRNPTQIIEHYSIDGVVSFKQLDKEKFKKTLSQQLESNLFNMRYKDYPCVQNKNLTKECTSIKLAYLQHYGVPTCLMDFTKNPFFALYFGISQVPIPSLMSYSNGKSTVFPEKKFKNGKEEPICFLSVYQIKTKLLQTLFGINV